METRTTTFYSPSSILSIFNVSLQTLLERNILSIKGVYQYVEGINYSGYYYDKLKDEATDKSIKLLVPAIMRKDLKNNTTIEIKGHITRKLDNLGRIDLLIVLNELLEQRANRFSEEDEKKIELLNRKAEIGFKDLDALIKKRIFERHKMDVHVVMGKNAIIDNDIKSQLSEGIALYNIHFHRVSLTTPQEIIGKISSLNQSKADIICLSRGGGENLEVFDKTEICEAALNCSSIIASAIGHADNVTLFEKLADKKFTTPTAFGQYLKDIYNNTLSEYEQSRAKLAADIQLSLEANYAKQLLNLSQQLDAEKALKAKTLTDQEDLYKKTIEEARKLHAAELEVLSKQLAATQQQHQSGVQERDKLIAEREGNLNKRIEALVQDKETKDKMLQQAQSLSEQFRRNLEQVQNQLNELESGITVKVLAAAAAALVLGVVLGKVL